MLEGKIEGAIFSSWCTIIVGNLLMLMLKGKLASASFPSQWKIFLGNALDLLVLEGKLACVNFHS